jgi:hypothetical protein
MNTEIEFLVKLGKLGTVGNQSFTVYGKGSAGVKQATAGLGPRRQGSPLAS